VNDTTAARKLRNLFAGPGPAHWADICYGLALLGVSQSQVAKELGVNVSSVNKVIRGTDRSYDVATHLAALLQTTVRRLWGDAYDYAERRGRSAA